MRLKVSIRIHKNKEIINKFDSLKLLRFKNYSIVVIGKTNLVQTPGWSSILIIWKSNSIKVRLDLLLCKLLNIDKHDILIQELSPIKTNIKDLETVYWETNKLFLLLYKMDRLKLLSYPNYKKYKNERI